MNQEETLYGTITAITKTVDVIVLSFMPKNSEDDQTALALTVDPMRYDQLTPTGDPALGVEVAIVVKQVKQIDGTIQPIVQNIYNPNGEFVAVDELPELANFQHETLTQDALNMSDLQAQVDATIKAIQNEPGLERDLITARKEEVKEAATTSTDNGDPLANIDKQDESEHTNERGDIL
ncbi:MULTISPECIES: hypothetical protein [unclassified Leuconostoc]|uniref:hypothetical protein n=1 Tax=unclassified Leuconostoc TaxID=2685106 RepID=UPI00190419A8|nr:MULTISPECIES: hypothetical protein [unclassified Leuconostoc]MBK0040782.1 hypothetical protein [Leuconostoc sp. S51]MBK0051796.1 hypothetical protein [Leuconostoc sp. S50]